MAQLGQLAQQQRFINRTIILSDYVQNDTVGELIGHIVSINMHDEFMENQQVGYERYPIVLIVNSGGGECYSGWGLIDTIETSATPIITVCFGICASMALAIFLSGTLRFMGQNSKVMYHEVSSWNGGKLSEQKMHQEEMEELQCQYDLYVTSKTKITEEKLLEVRKLKKDWYIDATESIALGVCNQILDAPIYWHGE